MVMMAASVAVVHNGPLLAVPFSKPCISATRDCHHLVFLSAEIQMARQGSAISFLRSEVGFKELTGCWCLFNPINVVHAFCCSWPFFFLTMNKRKEGQSNCLRHQKNNTRKKQPPDRQLHTAGFPGQLGASLLHVLTSFYLSLSSPAHTSQS